MGKKKVVDAELDGLVKRKKYLERRHVIAKRRSKRFCEKMSNEFTTMRWIEHEFEEIRLKVRDVLLSRMSPEEAQAARDQIRVVEELDRLAHKEDLRRKMVEASDASARAYKHIEETVLGPREPDTLH